MTNMEYDTFKFLSNIVSINSVHFTLPDDREAQIQLQGHVEDAKT